MGILSLRQPNVNKHSLQKSKHQAHRIFVVTGDKSNKSLIH